MKSSTKNLLLRVAIAVAAAACMAPGCNGDVLNDSTFRLWCGDTLCDWKLDAGHVNRVPTWHPNDYGVEFADKPTQISQKTDEASDCMEFSAVADVDASANAEIAVDFNLDGIDDYTAPIPESNWHVTKTNIYGPTGTSTINFIVRKKGDGHAVLAEIRLQRVTSCSGDRSGPKDVALGALCSDDSECVSGGVCCPVYLTLGVCSTCCAKPSKGACSGAACAKADPPAPVSDSTFLPYLCDPGLHLGGAGAPCVNDLDCTSGHCDGATPQGYAGCDAGVSCSYSSVRVGKCI